ncbi:T-cell immunomodulatory protein [Agrilus planipennis]|uniref:T-cell immunomodulatory protein n=1 Tax=Agrilus planipennis TaxID=224129 RepID=A0A1W4WFN0_AGRPL|nr:T-cell immunomodulatory protein [Agrilus planipennis]
MAFLLKALFLFYFCNFTFATDITNLVFGEITDVLPAAFGDFNSDELTDVFVLGSDGKTVEILLAAEEEPLLRRSKTNKLTCKFEDHITSVVPGDFDGDALMDVLVTTVSSENNQISNGPSLTSVHICWGGSTYMNCSRESEPVLKLIGQPLALDYNEDMIIDLFGVDKDGKRAFWIFDSVRGVPFREEMAMERHFNLSELSRPHAHAFLDLNNDFRADLFITSKTEFEIWYGEGKRKFAFNHTIPHPKHAKVIGQSLYIDVELKGQMKLVTPVCYDKECTDCALLVYLNDTWQSLGVNFEDGWCFARIMEEKYTNVITLHSGDFNMDGYPDILTTLKSKVTSETRSFLLENIACKSGCDRFSRNYQIQWNALNPFTNSTAVAVFFDFYQDGTLDVILVRNSDHKYRIAAFKNTLDYDANFIKVMVLTGLTNDNNAMIDGRVAKKRRTYGTNLPGPSISYRTTTQEGYQQHGISAQLPQSAHFSLNLPYTIFGLGRTPNFVDTLVVGLSNYSKEFNQIIPNSQMVVIPWPANEPSKWKAQLFVTPSKVILTSVAALTGICGLITLIIGILYWKERQEDKKERLQESHRFHFDAM